MIKLICKDRTEPVKEEYPCLKISDFHRIVAFTGPRSGYELRPIPGDDGTLFYYSDKWSEEMYKSYNGTVEFSNDL